MTELRPELEPLPQRMQHLKIDSRGYVVPWFVEWIPGPDGEPVPEFRASSRYKVSAAHNRKLCWVCGEKIGSNKVFVVGPMCGLNRISSEPPSHVDCARWSARNCPFLTRPRMVRRTDETFEAMSRPEEIPGIMVERNPGVTLLWCTKDYSLVPDHKNSWLFGMGAPQWVEWYAEGRPAKRAEIEASVLSGLPELLAMVPQDAPGWIREEADLDLAKRLVDLRDLYPAEATEGADGTAAL